MNYSISVIDGCEYAPFAMFKDHWEAVSYADSMRDQIYTTSHFVVRTLKNDQICYVARGTRVELPSEAA